MSSISPFSNFYIQSSMLSLFFLCLVLRISSYIEIKQIDSTQHRLKRQPFCSNEILTEKPRRHGVKRVTRPTHISESKYTTQRNIIMYSATEFLICCVEVDEDVDGSNENFGENEDDDDPFE